MSVKTSVLCLLFIFFSISLSASALNVGYSALGNGVDDIEIFSRTCLETAFLLLPRSDRLEDINHARYTAESDRAFLEYLHDCFVREREKGDFSLPEYTPYYEEEEKFLLIRTVAAEEFLSSRNMVMLEHVSRLHSLDVFFSFMISSEGEVSTLEVYMYADGKIEELFSSLYITGRLEEEMPSVMAEILSCFAPSHTLVSAEAFPSSRFFIDEATEVFPVSGWLLVPSSLSGMRICTDGYYDLQAAIKPGQNGVSYLEGSLTELPRGSITVTAHPYASQASLFGLEIPQLPQTLSFDSGVLIMTVSNDGFESEHLQLTGGSSFYSVTLKPQWMAEGSRVLDAKEDMYRSLRNTILSFALYVAAGSIANIYPQTESWIGPAGAISAGICVINLLDFVRDCLVYYDTARQVYM